MRRSQRVCSLDLDSGELREGALVETTSLVQVV